MKNKQIKCPQCGLLTFYTTENPFRPFCSERCKLIDLGDWASERYKVPSSQISPDSHWNETSESDQNDDPNGEL